VTYISRQKSTWINVGFKYLQLAVTMVSGLVLVPVYLRYLPIEQYGAWLTVGSVVIWLAAFDPGLANLLIQRVAHASGAADVRAVRGYVYAGLVCGGVSALLVAIAGNALAPVAVPWMGLGGQSSELMIRAFRVAAWTTGLMVLGFSLMGASLGLQRSMEVGVLFVGSSVVKIIVVLVLLSQGVGLMALPYSDFGSALWVVAAGTILLWRGLRQYKHAEGRIGMERLSELTGLFMFSLGARLGKVLSRNLDNVIIARALGPEVVAIYSLTATAPRQSENLINMPVAAFRPAIAHLAGTGDAVALRYQLSRLLSYVFWGMGLIIAGLMAFTDDFVRLWVGGARFAGADVALALCLVFVVHVWSHALGTLSFSLGDIRRNSIAEWASSLLLFPAIILGARYGSLLGVVLAHVAVACTTTCWYFPWSLLRRAGFDKGELRNLAMGLGQAMGCALICGTGFNLAAPGSWGTFVGFGLALTATYSAILGILSTQVRQEVTQWLAWGLARRKKRSLEKG
jgi:O-antigen/teichoic acid export membrane protein